MAQVPHLTTQARLVCIRTLLDTEDGQPSKGSDSMMCHLLTDLFTAVSQDILKVIIERLPYRVDNTLLLALCPPHIRSIHLRNCNFITSIGMERLLVKCSRLEKVDLSGVNQLMRPTFFQLCGCVGPQITSIDLEGNPGVTDECVHALLMNMPNLLQIGLSLCDNITDDAFLLSDASQRSKGADFDISTKDVASSLPRLRSVDIQGCRSLSSTAIRHLTRLCGPSLRHIDMSCTKIDCTALWFLSGYSLSLAVQLAVTIEDHLDDDDNLHAALGEEAQDVRLHNVSSDAGAASQLEIEGKPSLSLDGDAPYYSGSDLAELLVSSPSSEMVCGQEKDSFVESLKDSAHSLACSDHPSLHDKAETSLSPITVDPQEPSAASCLPKCDLSPGGFASDIVIEDTDSEEIHLEDMIYVPSENPFAVPTTSSGDLFLVPSDRDKLSRSPCTTESEITAIKTKCENIKQCFVESEDLPGDSINEGYQLPSIDEHLDCRTSKTVDSKDEKLCKGMNQIYKPNLESIEISFIQFHGEKLGRACLEALFLTNPNIKEFAASWTRLDDDMLDFIANHGPGITSITLTDCDLLTTVGVASLAQKCKNLRKLHLQGVSFIGDAAIFPVVSHVQSLNLAETNVTDVLLNHISEVSDDHLKELDLSWCEELTDAGLAAITANCNQLRTLSLRQSCASDNTVRMMAENCTHLEEVNLSSLSSFSNEVLCLMAQNLRYLTKVDISWNMDITDAGICALLKNCVYLREAQLAGLKQLSANPFLPIITDVGRWRKCQALLRLKLQERQVLAEILEDQYSSDEEFEELYLPHRSIVYAPNLSLVDLTYCDSVNDGHLAEIVAVCRGTLTVRDYYGSLVQPCFVKCQQGKVFLAPKT